MGLQDQTGAFLKPEDEYGKDLKVGSRVELCPSLDLWMRGARFGTIRRIEKGRAKVKLDHPQVRFQPLIPLHNLRLTRF